LAQEVEIGSDEKKTQADLKQVKLIGADLAYPQAARDF
jgi:hypothetical protein